MDQAYREYEERGSQGRGSNRQGNRLQVSLLPVLGPTAAGTPRITAVDSSICLPRSRPHLELPGGFEELKNAQNDEFADSLGAKLRQTGARESESGVG